MSPKRTWTLLCIGRQNGSGQPSAGSSYDGATSGGIWHVDVRWCRKDPDNPRVNEYRNRKRGQLAAGRIVRADTPEREHFPCLNPSLHRREPFHVPASTVAAARLAAGSVNFALPSTAGNCRPTRGRRWLPPCWPSVGVPSGGPTGLRSCAAYSAAWASASTVWYAST